MSARAMPIKIVAGAIAVFATSCSIFRFVDNHDRATAILGRTDLFWSISHVDCNTMDSRDEPAACAFEIDPAQFGNLLLGHRFELQAPPIKRSYENREANGLGPNFGVVFYFVAQLPDSKYSHVDLFADLDRRHVVAWDYIE